MSFVCPRCGQVPSDPHHYFGQEHRPGWAHGEGECPESPLHDIWSRYQAGQHAYRSPFDGILRRLGVPMEVGRMLDPQHDQLFLVGGPKGTPGPWPVWDACHVVGCVWVHTHWRELFNYLVAMRDFHLPLAEAFVRQSVAHPEFLQAAVMLARVAEMDSDHLNALKLVGQPDYRADLSELQRWVLSDMMALYQTWTGSSLEAR